MVIFFAIQLTYSSGFSIDRSILEASHLICHKTEPSNSFNVLRSLQFYAYTYIYM